MSRDPRLKESIEQIEEEKMLTGPGKKDPKRLIGIYTMKGKWIKDMNSEAEAKAFVNKSWGETISEDEWGGGFQTYADAQRGVQAGLKADYNRERNQKLKLVVQVIRGEISKQKFKKLAGISYDRLMDPTFKNWYVNQVKKMPKKALAPVAKAEDVEVDEAYAPLDTKGIVGAFTEATEKKRFEYRTSTDSWGKSHGLPHEVCVSYGGDRKEQWRSANVKGTVCYIAVDEGADGKPVMEKWAIRNHVKYVKAESVEVAEAATIPQQTKNTYEAREAQAKEIAAKILQVAKERGVRVYTDGKRVVSADKEFPKGDIGAFNKAYNDCGMVLTHMRFTKNSNQWGCESAGFGIGAQECVKAGRAQQHKSGDGGSLIIKFLKR